MTTLEFVKLLDDGDAAMLLAKAADVMAHVSLVAMSPEVRKEIKLEIYFKYMRTVALKSMYEAMVKFGLTEATVIDPDYFYIIEEEMKNVRNPASAGQPGIGGTGGSPAVPSP